VPALPQVVRKITRVLPLVGVVITTLLCASPVGQVSGVLKCAHNWSLAHGTSVFPTTVA